MIIIAETDRENQLVKELANKHNARGISRDDGYAVSFWSINDVKDVCPDISDDAAREFLDLYERRLAEQSISGGWDFLTYANYSPQKSAHLDLSNAAEIEYKGVVFDEWTVDEETGGVWGEMCQCCAEKYGDLFKDELSPGGVGSCSVKGCDVVGLDSDNEFHYYVDLKPELINVISFKQLPNKENGINSDESIPNFVADPEKMRDFFSLSKEEFLASYSYLTDAEYDETQKVLDGDVKTWYTAAYPDDEVGRDIAAGISFASLYNSMVDGKSFYSVIGDSIDSVVRERIFKRLSEIKDVDYREIYNLWLGGKKQPLTDVINDSQRASEQKPAKVIFERDKIERS